MLRGQASLQELVGRGMSFKRKPPAKPDKQKKRSNLGVGAQKAASSARPSDAHCAETLGTAADHSSKAIPSDPPEGSVVCPVCGKAVTNSDSNVEQHVGEFNPWQ